MKYNSTRGGENGLSFEDVLFAGYAKDGGLYMPENIPWLSEKEISEWQKLPYEKLVYSILRKFIAPEEAPNPDLENICVTSFERFCNSSPIGVKRLDKNLTVFELFYGPTLAFKDLALFVVAGLLDYFTKKRNKHLIALVGTSGDTGSSALESVRGKENLDLIVLLPEGRCSTVQRLQMTTIFENNTHVYSVEGTSDDLDVPIKQCFEDKDFVMKHNLISMNSINIGRILSQIPIYIFAYYQLASKIGEEIEIVVPTGGAGSITAGSMAHLMGFPIRLVVSVTVNDIVARTLQQGIFILNDQVFRTYANAIDIQVAYNLERIFYLYSEGDKEIVCSIMETFERNSSSKIPQQLINKIKQVIIDSVIVSDESILKMIKKIKEKYDYFICPHTATALQYSPSQKKGELDIPRGIFATASPEKFPEAISDAGFEAPDARVKHLLGKKEYFNEMKKDEDWLTLLKEKICAITASKTKD